MKAFWFKTYAGTQSASWLVLIAAQDENSIVLRVYDVEGELQNEYFEDKATGDFERALDFLEAKPETEVFEFTAWEEYAYHYERYYLNFYITYKHMFPKFGTDRDRGHGHDYQWYDQYDVLHHCQMLQRCLLFATQQPGLSQQEGDMLQITSAP